MSADNGVFVLVTSGPEYRVAYLQNIDAIYGNFNDTTGYWDGDNEKIHQFFDDAPVFNDIDDALNKAQEMADEYDYLEYGVCIINDFEDMKFNTQE